MANTNSGENQRMGADPYIVSYGDRTLARGVSIDGAVKHRSEGVVCNSLIIVFTTRYDRYPAGNTAIAPDGHAVVAAEQKHCILTDAIGADANLDPRIKQSASCCIQESTLK